MIFHYTLLCLAVTCFVHSNALENAPGERELRKALFQDYDKYTRPVKKYSTAVPVNLSFTPLGLNFLDEERNLMNLDSWVEMVWIDEYLTWEPADYDNIKELHVPPSEVWKPDIALYTASPDTSLFPTVQTEVILYFNGQLLWVPPFTISSKCQEPSRHIMLNDNKVSKSLVQCDIRMGSWTYSEKMLNLQIGDDKIDLSNFEDDNLRWKLFKVEFNREAKMYPCCPDAYPVINFNITFKRREAHEKGIRENSVTNFLSGF